MRGTDENMQEIKKILRDAGTPSQEFTKSLKKKVVREHDGTANLLFTLSTMLTRYKIAAGICSVFLVVGIGGAALILYQNTKLNLMAEDPNLLSQIILANAQAAPQNSNALGAPLANASVLNDSEAKMMPIRQEDRKYNYSTNTDSYEYGASVDKCAAMVPDRNITKMESAQYFEKKESFYPEYTVYKQFSGNTLSDYMLTVNSDQWQYKGGSYAIKIKNNVQVRPYLMKGAAGIATDTISSAPSSNAIVANGNTPAPTPDIQQMFGPNAKVLGVVTDNGKKYYKVHGSYDSFCEINQGGNGVVGIAVGEPNPNGPQKAPGTTTIYTEFLVDITTLRIVKDSLFLKNYDAQNMLYSHTSSQTQATVNFDQVKSQFTFSYNVPVKEYDASTFDYTKEYTNAVKAYIKDKKISAVTYLDTNMQPSYISGKVTVTPDYQKQFLDRAFYAAGSVGDKAYNQYKTMMDQNESSLRNSPDLTLSFSNKNPSAVFSNSFVSIFSGTKTLDEVMTAMTGGVAKSAGNVTVHINNQSVTGTLFDLTYPQVSAPSPSGSAPESKETQLAPAPKDAINTFAYVGFIYGGQTYIVQLNFNQGRTTQLIENNLKIKTISGTDSAAIDDLFKQINQQQTPVSTEPMPLK